MTDSEWPQGRHHIFLTVHANAVISLGNWSNIVEEVKRIIINLPDVHWPSLQVYGPTNERFGPGSFCAEMIVTGAAYRELNLRLQELPEWFSVPVHLWEVK